MRVLLGVLIVTSLSLPAQAGPDECCEGGEQHEGEPCGAREQNGGCNWTPVQYSVTACDTTWCGIGFADGGYRDTDWYLMTFDGGFLSATLESQFDGVVYIVDGIAECSPVVKGTAGGSSDCSVGTASALLPAGDYVIFAATANFDGTPCDSGHTEYRLTIDCESLPCPGQGNCFRPNGSAGCDDAGCCEAVCVRDPFCCIVDWDETCAAEAIDTCASCPADLNASGTVDVDDLVVVILEWGCQGACIGDVNSDGIVGAEDLIRVILDWGPCP